MFSKLAPRGLRSFKRAHVALLATGAALVLALGPVAGVELARAQQPIAAGDAGQLPSLSPLVTKVMPAVVNISVEEASPVADQLKLNNGSSREIRMVITFHSHVRFEEIIYRDAQN